jgi:DNA polymerase-1
MIWRLIQKSQQKKINLIFWSGVSDESSEENHHKYYKTLQDTEHSYQIIQGDLGLKLLLQNLSKQSSCFDTETTGLDALHAELVGIFSYEKGKDFTYPFRRIRVQKHSLKNLCLFENENREKLTEFEIWFKILSNYGINVEGKLFDTMIAHYLINPDMRHNMDILAETYLKYSQNLLKT